MKSNVEKVKFRELSNFFPKQQQALEMSKVFDYLLYGGTLGGGKSRFIRWAALYWLLKWHAELGIVGVRVGVFCETYAALNDRQLTYVKQEFPSWLGRFNEQRHEFTLSPKYGSGVIAFRNLDDPEKYLSVEFALEAIDEINRNHVSIFNTLRRRLRWPGIERPKFIGACNPIGEPWVTNYWIDRNFPPELTNIKDQFYFLESKPQDNPYLTEKYYEDLKTQDETFVKAALEGDWHAYDSFVDQDGYRPVISSKIVAEAVIDAPDHVGITVLLMDPAAGGDESAILLASETCKQVLFSQKLKDTMVLVNLAIKFSKENECEYIVLDRKGLGKPIFDRLVELGIPCIGVEFGEDAKDDIKYDDNKTELFFLEKEWILKGGRLVKHDRWNEWANIKYKTTSDGVIFLESKERLRKKGIRSPDVLDAAVLYHAVDLKKIKRKKREQRFGSPGFRDNIKDSW